MYVCTGEVMGTLQSSRKNAIERVRFVCDVHMRFVNCVWNVVQVYIKMPTSSMYLCVYTHAYILLIVHATIESTVPGVHV